MHWAKKLINFKRYHCQFWEFCFTIYSSLVLLEFVTFSLSVCVPASILNIYKITYTYTHYIRMYIYLHIWVCMRVTIDNFLFSSTLQLWITSLIYRCLVPWQHPALLVLSLSLSYPLWDTLKMNINNPVQKMYYSVISKRKNPSTHKLRSAEIEICLYFLFAFHPQTTILFFFLSVLPSSYRPCIRKKL